MNTNADVRSKPAQRLPVTHRVTVAKGDGIGPEIMDAVLQIMDAAGAPLVYDVIEIGEAQYLKGHTSGISSESWDIIRRNPVFLKAPITTPQGGGYKSLNVSIRKSLGLFANVRPVKSYMPFVHSNAPGMNLVIVRENEEDLYAGIEHRQTPEVTQVLKLITRPGTEKIVRYAFEYARAYGRKKVTCMTKDNIMKLTDGLFHKLFDEIGAEYPEIEREHMIIDIGAARLATRPERFDVIVSLNLYGDILSDIAADVAGSVGLAGSANIGETVAMFEAVHGSAPDIAGKGIANPSGLLIAATQMLVHLGESELAARIKNAWLCTVEDGIHTGDMYTEGVSKQKVGTVEFTRAIIDRLGHEPKGLEPVHYKTGGIQLPKYQRIPVTKELQGIDIFLDFSEQNPEKLAALLKPCASDALKLKMITNRGVKVWPQGLPETFLTDHWRCRFVSDAPLAHQAILDLQQRVVHAGLEIIKTENLYWFDGKPGYSLGQGE